MPIGLLTVLGSKGNKGDYEGTAFDSTKVNVLIPYSRSKENQAGYDVTVAVFGKSANFQAFKGKKYPLVVEADFEHTATGLEIYEIIKFQDSPNAISQAIK
jgi:hypothetical protein